MGRNGRSDERTNERTGNTLAVSLHCGILIDLQEDSQDLMRLLYVNYK